eukprot:TRINITY_DN5926_c0_g1_i10.p1 TRINITY_DN5926_c0_g1~~TRINITY_DN5926_c0_g1_i10.p1  ORF type:complete len:1044 (+),score=220.00 TRINITY_DN5926_c0_g1_i10:96-3227(+)
MENRDGQKTVIKRESFVESSHDNTSVRLHRVQSESRIERKENAFSETPQQTNPKMRRSSSVEVVEPQSSIFCSLFRRSKKKDVEKPRRNSGKPILPPSNSNKEETQESTTMHKSASTSQLEPKKPHPESQAAPSVRRSSFKSNRVAPMEIADVRSSPSDHGDPTPREVDVSPATQVLPAVQVSTKPETPPATIITVKPSPKATPVASPQSAIVGHWISKWNRVLEDGGAFASSLLESLKDGTSGAKEKSTQIWIEAESCLQNLESIPLDQAVDMASIMHATIRLVYQDMIEQVEKELQSGESQSSNYAHRKETCWKHLQDSLDMREDPAKSQNGAIIFSLEHLGDPSVVKSIMEEYPIYAENAFDGEDVPKALANFLKMCNHHLIAKGWKLRHAQVHTDWYLRLMLHVSVLSSAWQVPTRQNKDDWVLSTLIPTRRPEMLIVDQSWMICRHLNDLIRMMTVYLEEQMNRLISGGEALSLIRGYYTAMDVWGVRFGGGYPHPFWMDSSTKAILMELQLLYARGGHKRIDIPVTRTNALTDSFNSWKKELGAKLGPSMLAFMAAWNGTGVPRTQSRDMKRVASDLSSSSSTKLGCPKIFAYFLDESGQVLPGEGHGPRKELFGLLSTQLSEPWRDLSTFVVTTRDRLMVTCDAGQSKILAQNGNFRNVKGGDDICIQSNGATLQATVVSLEGVTSLRIDRPSTISAVNAPVTIARQPKEPPLFNHDKTSGFIFINADAPRTRSYLERYIYVGWLLGSSLTNRISFDFNLSVAFFSHLLDPFWNPSTDEGEENDPVLKARLDQIRELRDEDFQYYLEQEMEEDNDKETVQNAQPKDENSGRSVMDGILCDLNAYIAAVTSARAKLSPKKAKSAIKDRKSYLLYLTQETLVDSILWQMAAIRFGFFSVIHPTCLIITRASPQNLREIICSNDARNFNNPDINFDIRQIFHIVMDPDFQSYKTLEAAFWDTVDSLPPREKRLFVRFVTGTDRLPKPKTETIKVEMPGSPITEQDLRKAVMMLPEAHTCSNTLELPNYEHIIKTLRQLR